MRKNNPSPPERSAQRISEKTDRSAGPTACHPWTGALSQFSNPSLPIINERGQKSSLSARRFAWEAIHGPIPETRRVRVTCGNLLCMNLAHATLEPVKDPLPRFWKNVNQTPTCWLWTATTAQQTKRKAGRHRLPYGMFMVTALKRVFAHRYSWEIHNGPIPEGLIVCHKCDVPQCVNPAHLFLGTMLDNIHDAIAKGRNSRGEKHRLATAAGLAKGRATQSARRASTSGLPPVKP